MRRLLKLFGIRASSHQSSIKSICKAIMHIMDRASPSSSTSSEFTNEASPRSNASDYTERARDVLNHVIKTRKSWKSCKDGEVVWPLDLEAALLEGLEKYVPQDTRETRILGRFPMRNRFISDYIFQKTGKRRSAKQVGSRIQQLRDTCAGKRLSKLLHPFLTNQGSSRRSPSPPLRCDTDGFSDTSSIQSPPLSDEMSPGCEGLFSDDKCNDANPVNVIYIDILPPSNESTPLDVTDQSGRSQLQTHLTNQSEHVNYVQISQPPRHLRYIDPTITLVSQSTITARSSFTVRVQDAVVFKETTALVPAGSLGHDCNGARLYRTPLVPGYWETISRSADPTKFTIEQKVHKDCFTSSTPLFSAIYRFRVTQNAQMTSTPQHSQTNYSHTPDYFRIPDENGNCATGPIERNPQACDFTLNYPLFNTQASLEAMDNFIQFDDDDILMNAMQSLTVPCSSWATQSSSAQSSSSLLSVSTASSRQNSRSPASSSMSGTSPSRTSYMPSPILHPAPPTSSSPLPCQLDVQLTVPATASYLGLEYFPQDVFDSVDVMISNPYEIQS